jgi:uncharacterized membrane protein YhaH (DUF805 family)
MTPIDWAVRPLKRYSQFRGRAPRGEYWWFAAATVGSATLVGLVASELISGLFTLFLLVPGVALTIRRLHDSNRNGWWVLVYLGPLVAAMAVAIWAGVNDISMDNLTGFFVTLGFAMIGGILTLFSFMMLPAPMAPISMDPILTVPANSRRCLLRGS